MAISRDRLHPRTLRTTDIRIPDLLQRARRVGAWRVGRAVKRKRPLSEQGSGRFAMSNGV